MDDEPIILPFRRPAEAGQRPRSQRPRTTETPAEPSVWEKWRAADPEMVDLVRWLVTAPAWPSKPFDLVSADDGDPAVAVRVLAPERYRAVLLADAQRGPEAGVNVVGLRVALRRLRAVLGGQGRGAGAAAGGGPARKGRKKAAGGR